MIVAIPQAEVHRICSGQVVVDLATACKELIENALDAGATKIDVRLENYGADLIECVDNGKGINSKNHEAIALKYHTSKLASFNDLDCLTSFGFRGEALSSLCELSESFEVVTRTKEEDQGHHLHFNNSGKLTSDEPTARLPGTTVRIANIFSTMPVRRKEMLRSLKRQYAKMLSHLQAYAVIQTKVRMSVTMTTSTGKKQRVLSTQASGKIKNNLISVFGNKFATSMVPVEFHSEKQNEKKEENDNEEESKQSPKKTRKGSDNNNTQEESLLVLGHSTTTNIAEAWVSKPGGGIGRSTSERQFVFINQRPVDMPKVTRLFNEVWRQYEMKQKPAFVLNFVLPPASYDINIAPNKREVFLVDEARLHDVLRAKLETIWEPTRYTFKVKQVQSMLQPVVLKKMNTARRATGGNMFLSNEPVASAAPSVASSSSSSSSSSSLSSSSSSLSSFSSSSLSSTKNTKDVQKDVHEDIQDVDSSQSSSSSKTLVGRKRKIPPPELPPKNLSIGGVNIPNTKTSSKKSRSALPNDDEDDDGEGSSAGKDDAAKEKDTR